MHIPPPSRESLLRYLLNEIDETEREQVDTLLIADAEYEALFQEVEYDLVDALASGELTADEAARARSALRTDGRFLAGRRGLRRDAVVSLESRPSADVAPIGRRRGVPVFRLAVAALLLVAVALGVGRFVLHRASPADVSQSGPGASSAPAGLADAPDQAPSNAPRATAKESPAMPAHAPIAAVLLLAGASRSSGVLHLPVPHGASVVRFDWPAPENEAKTGGYRLQVLNDAGKVSCTSAGRLRRGGHGSIVSFVCAARDVPAGVDFVRIASLPADADVSFLMEATVSVEP